MLVYLDASAFAALHIVDSLTARARAVLATIDAPVIVSDLTMAEFASVVARRHRIEALTRTEAEAAIRQGNAWTGLHANKLAMTSTDLRQATTWIESLELPLRTPDAIHLAIALRVRAQIVTFDQQMARCASSLGIPILAEA